MTVAWMMYGTVIGLLVATGGRAAESLARLRGYPVRWVWAGALAATLILVMLAPRRETSAIAGATPSVDAVTAALERAHPSSWDLGRSMAQLQRVVVAPLQSLLARAQRNVPAVAPQYLTAGWITVSASLLLLFLAVQNRFLRARRGWPTTDMHGVRVRVSPTAGPAVVGLSRPEIVVPRWLFGRHTDEQRLVINHEVEHLHARDPLMLAFGCLAIVLVPWNIAAWWMLGRLRLAVELDCDARVLKGDVAPHSYGELLIDLAEHCSGLRVGAPALADDTSHLKQRLMAMKRSPVRFALVRAGVAGVVASTALLAACEAKMPTNADVAAMDVASAERATKTALVRPDSGTRYLIDGAASTSQRARALRPDQIGSIEVVSDSATRTRQIRIRTASPRDTVWFTTRDGVKRVVAPTAGANQDSTVETQASPLRNFTGLVFINGTQVDASAMNALDRRTIVSVEVVKGVAATALSNDPKAANGIIKITTR